MFRTMRRKKQLLDEAAAEKILHDGSFGVLAVHGDEGYPYAVPLSYAFVEKTASTPAAIVFHCAKSGHKLDAIERDPKVSFTVVAQNTIVPDEFTTYFRSVVAFGQAHVVEDPAARREAFELLAKKYSPDVSHDAKDEEIDNAGPRALIVRIDIEYMTGKQAKELMH